MKKIIHLCVFMLTLLIWYGGRAQVASYGFSHQVGTFTPNSSGANPVSSVQVATGISKSLPIGFTFIYGSQSYTNFKMTSKGYITFDTNATVVNSTNDLSTANYRPYVAPLWDNLNGTPGIASYQVTGSSPNRVLTVEWLEWGWISSTTPSISFQVKLYETTNVIEFVYKQETGSLSSATASIGISDITGSGSGTYLNLDSDLTNPSVTSTSSVTNINTKPADGQIFRFTPPSCLYMGTVTATATGGTTATLNLSTASSVDIDIYVSDTGAPPAGATPTQTISAGTTTVNLGAAPNPLSPSTTYTVYFLYKCSDGTVIGWFPYAQFNTDCGIVTGNLFDGFENTPNGASNNNTVPLCWTYLRLAGNYYGYTMTTTMSKTGNKCFYSISYLGAKNMVVSPETDNLGSGTKQLRFSVNLSYYYPGAEVNVYSMDGNTVAANRTLLQSIPVNAIGWKEYIVPIPNTTDDYFGISLDDTQNQYPIFYLDDIYYEDLWPCMFPGNVQVDPLSVTTTGADISWNASLDPATTGYEYEVRDESGTVVDSGSVTAPATSVTAANLNPGTKYYVYVRTVCGTTNGDWTPDPVEFMTNCDIFPANFFEGFENAPNGASNNHTYPDCWTFLNSRSTNTTYPWGYVYPYGGKSGSKSWQVFYYNYYVTAQTANNPFMLVSPETNNLGNGTKQLRFSLKYDNAYNLSGNPSIEIVSLDSNTAGATKTVIQTIQLTSSMQYQWVEFIVPIPATTDDYFAFSVPHFGSTTNGSEQWYFYLDDIYYEDLMDCVFPTGITVNNITTTSASVAWNMSMDPNATGYEYEVLDDSGNVVASGTTTGTSLPLNGLTSATNYTIRLRSICGTATGGWSSPVPFTTLCDVVTSDFFEGFEGYAYQHPVPTCWTLINDIPNGQGYVYIYGPANTGSNSYRIYNYRYNVAGDFMLISPETQDLGNGTKQVRFSFNLSYVYNTTAEMEVYSMDGNTATANKTLLQTITLNSTNQYKEYVVTFPATTDDYFAFVFPNNAGYWYGYMDDVYYEDIPPCQFPSNIEAININTSSATINWDASLSPGVTGYEYEVRTSGAAGSGAVGLFTSGTTSGTSVNLTGLSAATNYTVYVRAICGPDKGEWSIDPENFYTLCDVITYSFFEGFENTEVGSTSMHNAPYCWTYLKTGPNATYPAGYVATSYPKTDSKHFYVYRPHSGTTYSGESLLVSPETDNLGNGTKRLRFSARMLSVSPSYGTSLSIYTMKGNTVGDIATKTLLKTIYLNSASYTEYVVYFPANTTDDYFAFSFDDESITKYIFLDDIYYEDLPSCVEVPEGNITINKLTKDGFTVNWTDPYNNAASYEVEVRTSGTPGTPGAVFSTTTLAGATSVVVTGLDPSTAYQVYMRTMCSPLETSVWGKEGVGVQTLCNYPTLLSYTESAVYCGPQKADLTATTDDPEATISWFDNENDVEPIYEGEHFISENDVTQDRSYWLRSRRVVNDTLLGIDYGTSSGVNQGTFLYAYPALKHQYIFTAQELKDAGLGAGPIKALQFDVVSTGTRTRDGFTIYMGSTTQNTVTTTMIPTGNLQLVYNSGKTQKFNTGIMTFNLSTPYDWDGVSNIVVQTNWSNETASYPVSGALRYHTTAQNRTAFMYCPYEVTAAFMLATNTNTNSLPYTYVSTTNVRPNTRFLGTFVCQSNAVEIPIEVQPKPMFELSTYKVTSCGGDASEPVTIVTNFGGYDTFVWTPSTGVSGDAVSGWTFNTSIEQDYVLSATQSNGICEHLKTVRVFAGQKPIANPNLATLHEVCKNDIVTLDVLEKLPNDITIGTGLTNTSSSSLTSAFVHSAEYSKQQYIYSASELMTQGLSSAGYITGLAFNTINSGASMTNANYTIKFASVSNTTFANDNFYTGSFTTVYSTPVHTHTFQGWQQINFDSPFYWDGQSNILVEITQEGIDASSNNAQTYYTPVTGSDVGLYAGAETEEDLAAALGTRTATRLDARFSLQQATVQWSPATNLFVDAAATIPYTSGDSALTVYATSSTGGSFIYNALMTAPNGCAATQTYTVSVSDFGTPVVQDQTFCKTIAVTEVVVTGHQGANLYFYDSATSNTPITNITRSGVYYVVSGQGDCKSARVPFNVTIVVLTNPTVKQFTQVICGNGTVADLEATGTTGAQIKWYSSATSTTPLASTQTLVNNTTYYAAQALSGCESGRVAVLVNINPAPAALSPQSISICGGLNYADADLGQVAGSELVWYQSTTSQQPIPGTTQITTGTYYVSQKVNGCESPRAQIIVTAQSGSVSAPTATTQNICGGGTVADLVAQTAPGGVALWYNSSTSTTPLQPTDVLSSGTYYVAQRVGNCLSSKTAVSVRIVNVTIPSVAPITLCEGATVEDLNLQLSTPTGTSHKWYLNSTSTTPLDPTDVLSSGYYFVVRSQNSCESARVQVQVTINSRPSSPTGAPQQVFVEYAEIGYLEMDQTNVVWYLTYEDAMNGVNPLPANMPLVDKATYYAVIIGSNGCPSLPTAVEVIITVGVNDFDLTQLKYYPNPTSDLLTISYNEPIVKVEVFDLNGRMIMNRDFDKETVELDFSRLSSGTYMLNIKTKDSSQFVKIIRK